MSAEHTTQAQGSYTTISCHLPQAIAEEVHALARANERSVSGEIRLAIRKHLADCGRWEDAER